ncbi:hypothetical protein M8A51_26025 [Schlegelella sp. S2-27]|uniref:Sushi domain-containing protein n=1 Tax=Caldimonas mangrovi TaxID=2944811 RepID=A0ABT0YYT7_9BURK|nr:hypothetical protein [Caldimonas mangrovi]MCM5682983.1 hypothetical protein [Caldimonas mangrovi]
MSVRCPRLAQLFAWVAATFPLGSYAFSDYYWLVDRHPELGRFEEPIAACIARLNQLDSSPASKEFYSVEFSSNSSLARCMGTFCTPSQGCWNSGYGYAYKIECPAGKRWTSPALQCVPWLDRYHDKPQSCEPRFGHPIFPLTGSKRNEIELGRWLGEPMKLVYETRRKAPSRDFAIAFDLSPLPSFGGLWESSVHKKLIVQSGPQPAIQALNRPGFPRHP